MTGLSFETKILNWDRFTIQQTVSEYLLLNCELSQAQDRIMDQLVYRLKKDILTDTFARDSYTQTLSLPATSWQMFKHEHAASWWMRWLVKRKPVRLKTHTAVVEVERMHTYPESTLQREPRMGQAYIYERARPFWMDVPHGR